MFYNKSTNFVYYLGMSLKPPFPSMQFERLTPFLYQWSQPMTIKGRDFSQPCNPYTPKCLSRAKYLFLNEKGTTLNISINLSLLTNTFLR